MRVYVIKKTHAYGTPLHPIEEEQRTVQRKYLEGGKVEKQTLEIFFQ